MDRDYNAAKNILARAQGLGFVETEVTKSVKQEVAICD